MGSPISLGIRRRIYVQPERRVSEVHRASVLRTVLRLLVLLGGALRFLATTLWDIVRRRNCVERRAARLRQIIQGLGATPVKLGQQLSIRVDLLPYAYACELEKLLDRLPPFPFEQAVAAIERATGSPLAATFSEFDPEPVGSGSIACVYQARLLSGKRVAVKVRRPGIGKVIAADMRALSWLARFLELFLLAPRVTSNALVELRSMLFEELNLVREARYAEMFRKKARKALGYVTAPKVLFELSAIDVLVTEFVSGIWLSDIVAAVEEKNRKALRLLRRLDITPKVIAKRLVRTNRYGGFEGLFFHADIHPANVVVQPGNKLVLIDFGSCGSFTEHERRVWRQFMRAQSNKDVGNMVHAALALLEPLPPIDIDELRKRLEEVFWQDVYAFESKHSEWWERTTANIWIGFLGLVGEFDIPMNLNTLRMIRVTLLADTVAGRLWDKLDHYKEFRKFDAGAGKRAKKRLTKKVKRLFSVRQFVRLEQLYDSGSELFYRFQRILDQPILKYSKLIGKAAFTVAVLFKLALGLGVITGGLTLVLAAYRRFVLEQHGFQVLHLMQELLTNGWYQAFLVLVAVSAGRRIYFRIKSREI